MTNDLHFTSEACETLCDAIDQLMRLRTIEATWDAIQALPADATDDDRARAIEAWRDKVDHQVDSLLHTIRTIAGLRGRVTALERQYRSDDLDLGFGVDNGHIYVGVLFRPDTDNGRRLPTGEWECHS